MKLIGIVGRSRVGKDTLASYFSETHEVRRLAQPVKDACKALYGWCDIYVEGPAKEFIDERWGVSPRQAMVHITKTFQDKYGPNFFTRRLVEEWDGKTSIIIPDVRYKYDVDEIKRLGGVTIKVTRESGPQHEFESGVDLLEADYTIENNGTLFDFLLNVEQTQKKLCAQ